MMSCVKRSPIFPPSIGEHKYNSDKPKPFIPNKKAPASRSFFLKC